MNEIEKLAGTLYEQYCQSVGGKAFNGDPLPSWEAFRADPSKQKQSDAWVKVAKTAILSSAPIEYLKSVGQELRDLCYEIEQLPASEQQTKISIACSAISGKVFGSLF